MDVLNNKTSEVLMEWYNDLCGRYPPCRYGIYILSTLALFPFITFVSALGSSLAAFIMISTAIIGFLQLGAIILCGALFIPILLAAMLATSLTVIALYGLWYIFSLIPTRFFYLCILSCY
ncbi:hypothetical protein BDA99DRAFT_509596 [Phascolomyces articulosus]|uniref:Uncharacterized protein n=1 Tax=Phascolomyces articulosus TaxID=60185 RepID=A0AAD5KAB2_9FUNG|nr:hypothetical protein BDA99DRAFT_509596 [Phascolomyces articulosus]